LKENKRRRRWGIFFKSTLGIYFTVLLILLLAPGLQVSSNAGKPHTGIVDIHGAIMPDNVNDADNVVSSLTRAFKSPYTKGIVLRINSPGGSPVQAAYIYDNITRLRKKYPDVKIYAVCSDVCASAAYYIASAANGIYANQSSLVGSIGVLLNGFGFVDTMKKLGITRRLITAGSNKGFLDPFSPMSVQQKDYAEKMLQQVHEQFIQAVEKGRGKRLDLKNKQLFSGLIWTGGQAKKLGLIDGFGSAGYVARTIIKAPKIVNYTQKPSVLDRIGKGLGASFTNALTSEFMSNGLNNLLEISNAIIRF